MKNKLQLQTNSISLVVVYLDVKKDSETLSEHSGKNYYDQS